MAGEVRFRDDVHMDSDDDDVVTGLLERCRRDHHAWINGDMSGYPLVRGSTIMGAFGGSATGESAARSDRSPFQNLWESGTGEIELVSGGTSGDLAWLIMIERASVKFAGHEEPHRWELRVTELFRREGSNWVRFHRHADPLVGRYPLDELLRLLESSPGD
jgi:hypothetical protein